jgi:hypothetical protein
LQVLIKKGGKDFSCFFLSILVIKTLHPDPDSLEMLDLDSLEMLDPDSINSDPQHWYASGMVPPDLALHNNFGQ